MFRTHPVFDQPLDDTISVWRYMDLSKFIWMIQRNALYFCRSDLMGDPFEGHYTKAIADQEEEHIQTLKSNSEFVALHSNNMDIALDLARKSFRLNTLELPQQLK